MLGDSAEDHMAKTAAKWLNQQGVDVMAMSPDKKDYGQCTHTFTRNSARSIIISDGKVAMIHSIKYDYYKFPGGGIENGENPVEAMIRETREEAGLVVVPGSVKEYGYVHRIQRSGKDATECFVE